jgi:hypothetical protein
MTDVAEPPSHWTHYLEQADVSSAESEEEFDGRTLELTDEVAEAVRALATFAEASPPVSLWRRPGAFYNRASTRPPPTAVMSLAAAAAVVQSGLPPCPYAPPGSAVDIQYLPPNNKLAFRCHHTNPAHCWDDFGKTPYAC